MVITLILDVDVMIRYRCAYIRYEARRTRNHTSHLLRCWKANAEEPRRRNELIRDICLPDRIP